MLENTLNVHLMMLIQIASSTMFAYKTYSLFHQALNFIRNIIKTRVKPVVSSKIVSLMPYYRPLKLFSKFSTRIKHACPNRVNVVSQFNCSEPRCTSVYIGCTTCTLQSRCTRHRYKSSSRTFSVRLRTSLSIFNVVMYFSVVLCYKESVNKFFEKKCLKIL